MPRVKKPLTTHRNESRGIKRRNIIVTHSRNSGNSKRGTNKKKSKNTIVTKNKAKSRSVNSNSTKERKNTYLKTKKNKLTNNIKRRKTKTKKESSPVRKHIVRNRSNSKERNILRSSNRSKNVRRKSTSQVSTKRMKNIDLVRMKNAKQKIIANNRRIALSNSITISRHSSTSSLGISTRPTSSIQLHSHSKGDYKTNQVGFQRTKWLEKDYTTSETQTDNTWIESNDIYDTQSINSMHSTVGDHKNSVSLDEMNFSNSDENDDFQSDEESLPVITVKDTYMPKTILKNPNDREKYEGQDGPHWSDWCSHIGSESTDINRTRSPKLLNFRSKVELLGEKGVTPSTYVRCNDKGGEACIPSNARSHKKYNISTSTSDINYDTRGRSRSSHRSKHGSSSEDSEYEHSRERGRSISRTSSSRHKRRHSSRSYSSRKSSRDKHEKKSRVVSDGSQISNHSRSSCECNKHNCDYKNDDHSSKHSCRCRKHGSCRNSRHSRKRRHNHTRERSSSSRYKSSRTKSPDKREYKDRDESQRNKDSNSYFDIYEINNSQENLKKSIEGNNTESDIKMSQSKSEVSKKNK